MAKAEWGLKRVCPSCSVRYYDMKKNPPVCPSCGTAFVAENLMRTRRGRGTVEKKAVVEAVAEVESSVDDIPVSDDEAEDTLIEDAEELGDDKVDEVVEVIDDSP